MIPDVEECAANACISPGGVFERKLDDPLRIRERQALTADPFPPDADFLLKVRDDPRLLPVHQAGRDKHHKLEWIWAHRTHGTRSRTPRSHRANVAMLEEVHVDRLLDQYGLLLTRG